MPFGRKSKGKGLEPADELARTACALFGNVMSLLERHYGKRRFDYARALLFVNAAIAEFYRLKRQAEPLADPRLAEFDRRAALSVATTLFNFGHIDDRDAFCTGYFERSLASSGARIADDLRALAHEDETAAERLGQAFRREVAGAGTADGPRNPAKFSRDLEDRLIATYRWMLRNPGL